MRRFRNNCYPREFPTPFLVWWEKGFVKSRRPTRPFLGMPRIFCRQRPLQPQPSWKSSKRKVAGVDCSGAMELLMSHSWISPVLEIMFSSNNTPDKEYAMRVVGATISLDAFEEHWTSGAGGRHFRNTSLVVTILEGIFELGTDMDNPGEAKFGMTKDQLLKPLLFEGKRNFGIHSFRINTVTHLCTELAHQLLNWLLKSKGKVGYFLGTCIVFRRHWCQLSSWAGAKWHCCDW